MGVTLIELLALLALIAQIVHIVWVIATHHKSGNKKKRGYPFKSAKEKTGLKGSTRGIMML